MELKPNYEYTLKQSSQFKKDFILIWKDPEQKIIRLVRLGSHSKLFDKQRKR